MNNRNCYVCDVSLTRENETLEHVILNAIGGKLKSKNLICRNCNSNFGNKIDAELASQLNPFSTLLNVKRHNGKPRNIKGIYKGTEFYIEPDGKMRRVKPEISTEGNKINIVTSTISEYKKVLERLKRRYPQLDVEELTKNAKLEKEYLSEIKVEMELGGENTFRSICKTAINYYILCGGNSSLIKHIIPYIKGEEDNGPVYYFYPSREVLYKQEKQVFHSLILIGDARIQKLFVYVELFNEVKFLVMLNDLYNGPEIYSSYHYDVVANEIIDFDKKFIITKKEIKKYANKEPNHNVLFKRLSCLLQFIDKVKTERRISEITSSAMKEVKKKYSQDEYEYFTPEMINYFLNQVIENFIISFQHRILQEEI